MINIYKVGIQVQNFTNYHSLFPFISKTRDNSQIDDRKKMWSLEFFCSCWISLARCSVILLRNPTWFLIHGMENEAQKVLGTGWLILLGTQFTWTCLPSVWWLIAGWFVSYWVYRPPVYFSKKNYQTFF